MVLDSVAQMIGISGLSIPHLVKIGLHGINFVSEDKNGHIFSLFSHFFR